MVKRSVSRYHIKTRRTPVATSLYLLVVFILSTGSVAAQEGDGRWDPRRFTDVGSHVWHPPEGATYAIVTGCGGGGAGTDPPRSVEGDPAAGNERGGGASVLTSVIVPISGDAYTVAIGPGASTFSFLFATPGPGQSSVFSGEGVRVEFPGGTTGASQDRHGMASVFGDGGRFRPGQGGQSGIAPCSGGSANDVGPGAAGASGVLTVTPLPDVRQLVSGLRNISNSFQEFVADYVGQLGGLPMMVATDPRVHELLTRFFEDQFFGGTAGVEVRAVWRTIAQLAVDLGYFSERILSDPERARAFAQAMGEVAGTGVSARLAQLEGQETRIVNTQQRVMLNANGQGVAYSQCPVGMEAVAAAFDVRRNDVLVFESRRNTINGLSSWRIRLRLVVTAVAGRATLPVDAIDDVLVSVTCMTSTGVSVSNVGAGNVVYVP